MKHYFVDTSALAKQYILESGSTWVQSWIEPQFGHIILISELSLIEMASVLARRHREGSLSLQDLNHIEAQFLQHSRHEYHVLRLKTRMLNQARKLTKAHPIRTLDAIQLSAAMTAQTTLKTIPLIFVSADTRLLNVAQVVGFQTEDVNQHP